jgi:cephalosporin hydroxylase
MVARVHPETPETRAYIRDRFHRLYYGPRGWPSAFWMGIEAYKCPFDLWTYQEILVETQPDLIIETGSAKGGSALFLADCCELLGNGMVLSIDIEPGERPVHPLISWVTGDSVSKAVLDDVRAARAAVKTAMVVLDSNHARGHVLRELRAYAPMVSVGCYLVVEDTNLNGHPIPPDYPSVPLRGPGPWEALEHWLPRQKGYEFRIDPRREKFQLTFNPGGYLLRVQ